MTNPRLPRRFAYLLLGLMMLLYLILQGSVAQRLHDAFVTGADDLSNIDQVVWNSQHGRLLERTTGTESLPRYGEHLEPIWIAMGAIYQVWDSVDALLFMQTLALGAGALPVFWLARDAWGEAGRRQRARRRAKGKRQKAKGKGEGQEAKGEGQTADGVGQSEGDYLAGVVFAGVYLLSPFVGRANSAEVHAMPFAVAPLLLAIVWGWQGRWRRVWPLAALLLLVREDAGLLVGALGLWALLARRAPRVGSALMAAGAAGLWLTTFVIIAHFAGARFGGGQSESIFFERYAAFGEGPLGILRGMLTRPDLWLALLAEPWRAAFLREFVLSTGGLMLLAPTAWLLFAPHFVLNLLSDYYGQFGGLQHYAAPLLPGLMASAILGGARLLRWANGRGSARLALLLLALGGTVWTARAAPLQPLARTWVQPPITAHHRLLDEVAAAIPPRAPLSADPQLHPHLAHRPDAYRFPIVGDNAEWILVDVTTNTTMHPADLHRELLARLQGGWGIAAARDGYLLLQRGAGETQLPDSFFSFAQPSDPPEVPLRARFGEWIEVLGYDVEQDLWGRVAVRWHLRPLAPLPPTLTLDTALLDPTGTPLPDTSGQPLTLLEWLPLAQWQPEQGHLLHTLPREAAASFFPALVVRLEGNALPLSIEGEAPPGPARAAQQGEWLVAGEWRLTHHATHGVAGWRVWAPPADLADQPAAWSVAQLAGWQVEQVGANRVAITLHWQATMTGAPPTQRFVHLVPVGGPPLPLAQADGPLGGEYPVPRWAEGEWVSETVTLDLPSELPDGWQLLVGLYDPASGARLPVTPDAGDSTFALPQPAPP